MKVKLRLNWSCGKYGRFRKGICEVPDELRPLLPSTAQVLDGDAPPPPPVPETVNGRPAEEIGDGKAALHALDADRGAGDAASALAQRAEKARAFQARRRQEEETPKTSAKE